MGFKRENFNEGLGLTHGIDGWLLSGELMKVINRNSGVGFGKTIPHWKFNSMRKMME
jgi:hypothetical protein